VKVGRYFVTGTDTGVGKTEVAAALLRAMVAVGHRPWAFKPCESGGTGDSEALREAAGGWQGVAQVCPFRFKAPLAPAMAARRERKSVNFRRLVTAFKALGPGPGVVEGAGGLFVPLTAHHDVIDLMSSFQLPVVVVARAGLGTVNHTTLTLNALAERRLAVAGVVLSNGQPHRDPSVRLNRDELRRRFPALRILGPVEYAASSEERRRRFAVVARQLVAR
jgi:dethiobiotin synthetase